MIYDKAELIKFLEIVWEDHIHTFDTNFGDMAKKDIADMVDNWLEREITAWIIRESA